MIPYSEWLDEAKGMPEGVRKRINHTCGGGRTMIISHDAEGFGCHCFRCNDGASMKHGLRPINKLFVSREENKYRERVAMPDDCVRMLECDDTPAIVWLCQAGITERMMDEYRIMYSPNMRRVILPVYRGTELVFTQARAVHGEKPKYLNPIADRQSILFESMPTYGDDRVVLTEDILSAIRVGEHVKTISLMGTSITHAQANQLTRFKRISIWLDGDEAGVKGAGAVRKMMSGIVPVDTILTTNDPKQYTNREIKEYLL